MRIIKKMTVLILAVLMLLGCVPMLASCGEDEGEVLAAFKDMYEKSVLINDIIYGDGLAHDEAYDYEGFGKVKDSAPYKTEEELKNAILAVYSKEYYETSLKYALYGTKSNVGNESTVGARYRSDKKGKLEVFVDYVKISDLEGQCVVNEAKVKSTWPDVIVSVPVEFNGVRNTKNHEVRMVKEDSGVWRFDSITQVAATQKDESFLMTEFKKLYAASQNINEIVLGAGLPYDGEYDKSSLTAPYYVPVAAHSAYKTEKQLETAILSVYSKSFYEDNIKKRVSGDPNISTSYARYKEIDGVLNVNVCDGGLYSNMIVNGCDMNRAEIIDQTSTTATITAPYVANGQEMIKTFLLKKDDGQWRLDAYSLVRA